MSHPSSIRVLGISGSLRKESYNTAVLRTAQEIAPEGMTITLHDISGIPLYNEDVYQKGFPDAVEKFRAAIRESHALLVVTPEYNYSIPGVLKNAIDYASRPPKQPFDSKPIAIMGASPSLTGTARAQSHLRQIFTGLNTRLFGWPELLVSNASQKISSEGKLTDEKSREILLKILIGLKDLTLQLLK